MENIKETISKLKRDKNAIIMAHYYQCPEIQEIADFVGDSLALAQKAAKTDADIIVMCGVHFMGETAKILCPEKKVLVPDDTAGCSLADSCKASDLEKFIKERPDHLVVSYVNTTADVKTLTDVVVTSGNARKIIDKLPQDAKIIFGPDANLGAYINKVTGRNMILWQGACHVHSRFSTEAVKRLKKENPQAKVLVHPECNSDLQAIADKVGSTASLLDYAAKSTANTFIVATERGILYEMQKRCKKKKFIEVPKENGGCNECEYMKQNTLEKVLAALRDEKPEIIIDEEKRLEALRPIKRMLEMS